MNQVLSSYSPQSSLGRSAFHYHERMVLNEQELAHRWGLSVKTLRRWRSDQLGPIFCKLGSRVVYLISEIEAFERRVSRHSTSVLVSAKGN